MARSSSRAVTDAVPIPAPRREPERQHAWQHAAEELRVSSLYVPPAELQRVNCGQVGAASADAAKVKTTMWKRIFVVLRRSMTPRADMHVSTCDHLSTYTRYLFYSNL